MAVAVAVAVDQLVCVIREIRQDGVVEGYVMLGGELARQGGDVVAIVIGTVQRHDHRNILIWLTFVALMHHVVAN